MENEKIILEEPDKIYNIRHRCFHFAKEVVMFVNDTRFEKINYSLFDQLVRSATSIGANLVEGGSGSSKKDFIKFLSISLKSANEAKYWICLIRDTLTIDKIVMNKLLDEADEISKIIATILIKTKEQIM